MSRRIEEQALNDIADGWLTRAGCKAFTHAAEARAQRDFRRRCGQLNDNLPTDGFDEFKAQAIRWTRIRRLAVRVHVPERAFKVLLLRYHIGCTRVEAATALNISLGTVTRDSTEAIRLLKSAVDFSGDPYDDDNMRWVLLEAFGPKALKLSGWPK